jgi:hypothetical protein
MAQAPRRSAARERGEERVDLVLVALEDPHLGDLLAAHAVDVRAPDDDLAAVAVEALGDPGIRKTTSSANIPKAASTSPRAAAAR